MKRTKVKQRRRLAVLGFVRVDGLCPHSFIFGFKPPLVADPHSLGRYGSKCGMTVLVTEHGEIWLASSSGKELPPGMVEKLCLNGEGADVPFCSWHNELLLMDILKRLANPNWMPKH